MQIHKVDIRKPNKKVIENATQVLMCGGIIIYPTDTCYGVGVNALDKNAVKKLYELKGRDFSKPTHVVVKDWNMIKLLTIPNAIAMKLYKKFLPGPLTIVLSKNANLVPDILTGGAQTLGVRILSNLVTQSISDLVPFPYTTPSANKTGKPAPYSVDEVKKVLDVEQVDLILDAGKLPLNKPSTLINLSISPPTILREGSIAKDQIEAVLGLTIDHT